MFTTFSSLSCGVLIMYKFAAQNKIRFSSIHGNLTVEQLFDLPLKSLDLIARIINKELKETASESFIEEVQPNTKLETAMAIIKDVIKTKQEENHAHVVRMQRQAERRKILDAIGAKKDAALTAASLEDLEKRLAALD